MDKLTNKALDHEWRDLILKALEAGMSSDTIRDFFRDYISPETKESVEQKTNSQDPNKIS
ncbi:DNA-binding anti-repressor SinI [Lederbergia galactosidilytica]|uniref:Sin domain-containing protein n=1 Tax=Lederbergia galactosidilytica TaxID=217031 RepID=A0A0Q9XUZ9_9BACI|nr:DNA-binding anti-repressor SinI [Lederbergia galactosidilytica]KRG08692.1 hypothetical protein ACA30_22495 [Virgibacillus soli]KRG12213.1 hypothetical protein ACA29_11905 [Lederbergia galactosidilytica]OAK75282.1 hypothetical protein ABB05_02765 [Lederbergia galactosidilytica]